MTNEHPSPPDWQGLCEELLGALENEGHAHWPGGPDGDPLIERARAALSQPEPEVAGELTDQELLRCANIATPCYDLKGWERELRMMRAAITADRARRPASAPAGERQAAPVPVALSERPWEREGWCDDEGMCWAFNDSLPAWEFLSCTASRKWADLFLPFDALPLPSVEVES